MPLPKTFPSQKTNHSSAQIIALVGMCGCGKSSVSKYLQQKGYTGIYFGKIVLDDLKKNNIPLNSKNEKIVREKLRKQYGMAAFAKISFQKIKKLLKNHSIIYIDGLYSWQEYSFLEKKLKNKIYLIEIFTDKKLRYKRLAIRKERPLDNKKAKKRDISEIENLAKGGPIAFSDFKIFNNDTIQILYKKIDAFLNKII